jgi:hypothetical protein
MDGQAGHYIEGNKEGAINFVIKNGTPHEIERGFSFIQSLLDDRNLRDFLGMTLHEATILAKLAIIGAYHVDERR